MVKNMAKVMFEFSQDEIRRMIPYGMICETRFGRYWETGNRRRRWLAEFSAEEREKCSRLFSLARTWHLVKGVPDSVTMSSGTLALWKKLEAFCASL